MQPRASTGNLPIGLRDLIHARSVEDNRREFKVAWNESTRDSVIRTVCAFANDLLNLNGGYVIIGIETDDNGLPVLPPRGLANADLGRIQREIRGQCNRIAPQYQPLLFPEVYDGRAILVVWAPGGDTRPYEAPSREVAGHTTFGPALRPWKQPARSAPKCSSRRPGCRSTTAVACWQIWTRFRIGS